VAGRGALPTDFGWQRARRVADSAIASKLPTSVPSTEAPPRRSGLFRQLDPRHPRAPVGDHANSVARSCGWPAASVDDLLKTQHTTPPGGFHMSNKQFLIGVTCRDEKEQVELLRRFTDEGWECKAPAA
jgi:hypothetical protein